MSIEDRVRSTLKEAGSRINPPEPNVAQPRLSRPPTKRRIRPVAAFMAGAVGVLILVAGAALFIGPYDPNALDVAATHNVETVEIADLAVPVVDSTPVLDNPSIWLGLPGPTPQFDTSQFGPDLSFSPGEPTTGDLEDPVVQAVYLGDLDSQPFYIYARSPGSVFDWIGEVIAGNFSGDIIGTRLFCCTGGDMDREEGLPGVSSFQRDDQPPVVAVQWLGLSPDVSVVAYQFDGEFVGWQTPVGGVSAIQPDQAPVEYLLVAFDAQGRELRRFGPHDGPLIGDTVTISFLLAQDGVEVKATDIATDALRDVIDLRQADRVFAVPAGEFKVYVVVRESGTVHVYATSCEVLVSAGFLLGQEGTCLERTINGQRETGVFDYKLDQG